jgi:hypothetical protein
MALPPYLTDFQGTYPEDFRDILRDPYDRREWDIPQYFQEYPEEETRNDPGDFYDMDLDARSEYADSNILKALNGEQMKVTGGNGAAGAYNEFPVSMFEPQQSQFGPAPSSESQEVDDTGSGTSADAGEINPYPSPPNPCPLPYPDENGQIQPYSISEGCIPGWTDDADLSKWFQEGQVGKSDDEHNGGPGSPVTNDAPDAQMKRGSASGKLPSYLKQDEQRETIRAKKG